MEKTADNFNALSWRERALRELIIQIAKVFTETLVKAYTSELREIDRIRREPGFAQRRLNTGFDEVDGAVTEGEEED